MGVIISDNRIVRMTQNESSSLCNLMLEDSDLKNLEELDPFQVDGYQTLARITLPVSIIYANQKGQETQDTQPLTLQLLTRSFKPAPKPKEPKQEPQLDSLRVCLFSEDDIFLSMVSTLSNSSFEALKTKNGLNLQFRDFPASLLGMLRNCGSGDGRNRASLRLSFEGTGRLGVVQATEYKEVELVELNLVGSSLEKAHQSIIYRYNFNRSKLSMLESSVESVYRLLAEKNPPLLAYIQKTVGEDS